MASHAHAHDEPHISPLSLYFAIYGSLLVLTVVTVAVSYLGLPPTTSIIVAMVVATIKGGLVATFFMHLKWDTSFNQFVFVASLWFMAIFFILTMFDLGSRDSITEVQGHFEARQDLMGKTPPRLPEVQSGTREVEAYWQAGALRDPAELWR